MTGAFNRLLSVFWGDLQLPRVNAIWNEVFAVVGVPQPSKYVYGEGAVALILVPLAVTAAPSPLGQAAGDGSVPRLCAVEHSSLAGCANEVKP